MKKKNVLSLCVLAISFINQHAMGQEAAAAGKERNGFVLNVGVSSPIATGNFNDTHKWGIGGFIQGDIPITQSLYATLNTGFTNFFGKRIKKNNMYLNASDAQFIPVKAGLKYFPAGPFYVQGDAGVSFVLNRDKLGYDRSAAFVYSPQVGVRLPLGTKNSLDLGLMYERTSRFKMSAKSSKVDYYGLKVAYPITF